MGKGRNGRVIRVCLLVSLFVASSIFFIACTRLESLGFEINKKIIYSQDCDRLLFSTNASGYFRPQVMMRPFDDDRSTEDLKVRTDNNIYSGDMSCDCSLAGLLVENLQGFKFDVALYNFASQRYRVITESLEGSNSHPVFVGNDSLFILNSGHLKLYHIQAREWEAIDGQATFSHIFKADGRHILLQDDETSSIWVYDVIRSTFEMVWQAESPFTRSRQIRYFDRGIYFISDHIHGFNAIFRKGFGQDSIALVKMGNEDYYLGNNQAFADQQYSYIANTGLYFVSNNTSLPDRGVIYDEVNRSDKTIMLYADLYRPASLYVQDQEGGLTEILGQYESEHPYDARIIAKENAVADIVFMPDGEIKDWVVWLHGGPHEQVSLRYNPYFDELIREGFGVIALNYPGSTGKGNELELQGIAEERMLAIQQKSVLRDLENIFLQYHIENYSVIGVSYGSRLGQSLLLKDSRINKFVDFSGIGYDSQLSRTSAKRLYIFGEYDYVLANSARVDFLNAEKSHGSQFMILKDEGHAIAQNNNMVKVKRKIIAFLKD